MPKIPASCFHRETFPDGDPVVCIDCTSCGEMAIVSTAWIQLPICVHNSHGCPLLNLGVHAMQDLGNNVLSTGSTGPTTTGLIDNRGDSTSSTVD